jgi:NADPH:quinone reductase-like Zn-dependent oxidoreductase
MKAVLLTGHGGLDKLEYHTDVPVPEITCDEVLIKVLAAAVNNTDINTRIGWYSKSVRGDTGEAAAEGYDILNEEDGGWGGGAISFPRIQGADVCGRIVAVGSNVDPSRIGERVLIRALQTTGSGGKAFRAETFGSECDGGFAEYTKTWASEAIPVECDWSDIELATIPCACSTAEGMLQRASVGAERVLITGASGGVGSAAVQLCKRRGAHITAMTSADKAPALKDLGSDEILGRDDPIAEESFDVIIDLVAGPRWPALIEGLTRGGRYVTAGAIAGPIVEFDVRTLYLHDLTLFGSTYQPVNILPDVVSYIEKGDLRPLVAEVFPLKHVRAAQEAFLEKGYIGKIAIQVAD